MPSVKYIIELSDADRKTLQEVVSKTRGRFFCLLWP